MSENVKHQTTIKMSQSDMLPGVIRSQPVFDAKASDLTEEVRSENEYIRRREYQRCGGGRRVLRKRLDGGD